MIKTKVIYSQSDDYCCAMEGYDRSLEAFVWKEQPKNLQVSMSHVIIKKHRYVSATLTYTESSKIDILELEGAPC